jgi:hypothetical protein
MVPSKKALGLGLLLLGTTIGIPTLPDQPTDLIEGRSQARGLTARFSNILNRGPKPDTEAEVPEEEEIKGDEDDEDDDVQDVWKDVKGENADRAEEGDGGDDEDEKLERMKRGPKDFFMRVIKFASDSELIQLTLEVLLR